MNQQELKELLEYREGKLYWKKKISRKVITGREAGYITNQGYCCIKIKQGSYLRSRLVWLYHHGKLPDAFMDHINGITYDDRIENLREATNQQNQFNRKSNRGSSSKYKGVHWCKKLNKWIARYTIDGKKKHIGVFTNEVEAAKAYDNTVVKFHGKYRKDIFNG